MKFILRWLVTSVALLAAVALVPGIEVNGNAYLAVVITALILGFLNAILRPILVLLSCGFIVITLGLFMFVINALVLWASANVAQMFGIGFYVDGFIPALLGSLVVSIVSFLLSIFLNEDNG